MTSIKDVAKQASVSIATVSHALRGTKPVSDELRKRINNAVKELNYQINPIASNLKRKTTHTIGVVVTNMNRVFFPQVIKGIHDFFLEAGYRLSFCDTDDDIEKEKAAIEMLCNSWVDGIILDTVASINEQEYFDWLVNLDGTAKRIPIVSLERGLCNNGIDSVVVDNYKGGRIATKHLIECGCDKIIHISGPSSSCMVQSRLQGYYDELGAQKKKLKPTVVTGDFSPMSGYQAIKEFLLKSEELDGIFAANDQMAIGALKALHEHGFLVPEDVKIVGFDNTFVASIISPSLTTINVPKYQMGLKMAKLLLNRINDPAREARNEELPIQLVVRQSTDLKGEGTWELFGW